MLVWQEIGYQKLHHILTMLTQPNISYKIIQKHQVQVQITHHTSYPLLLICCHVLIIVFVLKLMASRIFLKYIHCHPLHDSLRVFVTKVWRKRYPKSMTFNVLQSVHTTITRSALRYSNGLSLICVWLKFVVVHVLRESQRT